MEQKPKSINKNNTRFSRDGDQFHYLWTARQCLKLLSPKSDLVAIAVEGPSPGEGETLDHLDEGEEVIDTAEYYGNEDLSKAKRVCYFQCKHSTATPTAPWTLSGLSPTIQKFALIFQRLKKDVLSENPNLNIEFGFISNRPIAVEIIQTLEDISNSVEPNYPKIFNKLKTLTTLSEQELVEFCQITTFTGSQLNYQSQRDALHHEINAYLPENDADAPSNLRLLIIEKATSVGIPDPCIRRTDVLRTLGVLEEWLFPAASRFENLETIIPRNQETQLISSITTHSISLICAEGGVGKSVFAQTIVQHLPPGSAFIAYDCFGNGEYRQKSKSRHRHKDGLVQIANELCLLGLCDPLIPSIKSDSTAYLKAFVHRLSQSAKTITAQKSGAILCIAIDAADNAQMAAEEFGDGNSFVKDLLRETLPDSVHIVLFCRPERISLLNIPPTINPLNLGPFTESETQKALQQKYPDATEQDSAEFHRLTSGNPRLQANALAEHAALSEVLSSFGSQITSVDSMIEAQLKNALNRLKDHATSIERQQIDLICVSLSVLKPLIPISILAQISGANISAIKSFITDFGRPLLLSGDAIRFRDEPVETWFRNKFKATRKELETFITELRPLAHSNSYVATCIPFLMLETGQLTELINIALNDAELPLDNPIERREVKLQRIQIAIIACLRTKQYKDAAKLAFKASGEAAGNSRQETIFKQNTDLIAKLTDDDTTQDIAFRKRLQGGWLGSSHVYKACLLSHIQQYKMDARSQLRMAYEWLDSWSELTETEKDKETVEYDDIAQIALAELNLHGPDQCASLFELITDEAVFNVGKIISRRLIDHKRYEDLNALGTCSSKHFWLLLAILLEMRRVCEVPNRNIIEFSFELLKQTKLELKTLDFKVQGEILLGITAITEAAYIYNLDNQNILASILSKYLPEPPRELYSDYNERRSSFLSASSFLATLQGKELQLIDLADPELRKLIETGNRHHSKTLRDFNACIGALLPWHNFRSATILSKQDVEVNLALMTKMSKDSEAAILSSERNHGTLDEIAKIWFSILIAHTQNPDTLELFKQWATNLERPLFISTWIWLARSAARIETFAEVGIEFCQIAVDLTDGLKEDAENKASLYIECARALLPLDISESKEYLNKAIEIVSKFGDEVSKRWEAMTILAENTAGSEKPDNEIAYRFAHCAETVKEYLHDYFDWSATISSITSISPIASLAIISCWRDNRFGELHKMLPIVANHLLEQELISGSAACILVVFKGNWDQGDFAEACLKRTTSPTEKQTIWNHLLKYFLEQHLPNYVLDKLEVIGSENNLDISDITTIKAFNNSHKTFKTHNLSTKEIPTNWNNIFSNLDLSTTPGLTQAYNNFRTLPPPWYHEEFWSQIIKRIETGKETEFLKAYSDSSIFELFHLKDVMQSIPASWKNRTSIKKVLTQTITTICKRYCFEITNSRYYQTFPLKMAEEASLAVGVLAETILQELGMRNLNLDTEGLFKLVGLLTLRLSKEESLEVLSYALGLLEDELEEERQIFSGISDAGELLPSSFNQAIANFLWVTLAAPEAPIRWQAAHAVRAACSLQQSQIVDFLTQLSISESGNAFANPEFPFYYLHGRLYLLIGLARAVIEDPNKMQKHLSFFRKLGFEAQSHILIRYFAILAIKTLIDSNVIIPPAKLKRQVDKIDWFRSEPRRPIENIAQSLQLAVTTLVQSVVGKIINHFNSIISIDNIKRKSNASPSNIILAQEKPKLAFSFNLDIEAYWFPDIAECFHKSVPEIIKLVEQTIVTDWKLNYNGYWNNDPRHELYNHMECSHSHGTYPKTDNLAFYLTYHSMMEVAGRLANDIKLKPHRRDQNNNRLQEWLEQHTLTRKDNRWIADRIDPPPLEWRNWKNNQPEKNWRWLINVLDFREVVSFNQNNWNIWGRWTWTVERYEETIHIKSALISTEQSQQILKELQTASYYDYNMPASDEQVNTPTNNFELKGWIEDKNEEYKLDEYDPWTNKIKFPPLCPSKAVCDLFHLTKDVEQRMWNLKVNGQNEPVLWSQLWGNQDYIEEQGDHGKRLIISRDFLLQFLQSIKQSLLIEVCIERKIRRHYTFRSEDEPELEYVEPYRKLFAILPTGKIETL